MSLLRSFAALLCLLFATNFAAHEAFAWGERGHDLIARVAARLVHARHAKDKVASPFVEKEHMLGHLANVPDIVWRNADKETVDSNSPTHYIDLEYFAAKVDYASIPQDVAAAQKQMKELCDKAPKGYVCPEEAKGNPTISMAGSAPFRIRQLATMMTESFKKAKAANEAKDKKALNAAVNEALLAGGIMAHFIGDLGNPHHATRDYNGYEIGQGGIHSYFESDAVNALPLTLDQEVYNAALSGKGFARVQQQLPAKDRAQLSTEPLPVALALVLDSFARIKQLNAIDKQFAVTKVSSTANGMKIKAERKAIDGVAPKFHDLIVERLSTAADTLAHVWVDAWKKGGSPDLSDYDSWDYPVKPDFIKPDYLATASH